MPSKYITELPHFVVNIDTSYMKSRREIDAKAFDSICNRFKLGINSNVRD